MSVTQTSSGSCVTNCCNKSIWSSPSGLTVIMLMCPIPSLCNNLILAHDSGHSATDVASRSGVPVGLLYTWTRKLKGSDEKPIEDVKALQAEMTKLKEELRRTTEERDILKKAAYFAKVSE